MGDGGAARRLRGRGAGLAELPGDCDDGDPALHPGAADVCDDGVDQDCDGLDHPCLQAGAWVVDDIAVADGLADIVVGSDMESSIDDRNGAAYVYLAPVEGRLGVGDAWFTVLGGTSRSHLGVMVDGGTDLDGDGRPDLALGAHRDATAGEAAGRAWIASLWEP